MVQRITLADSLSLGDLHTYLQRAGRVEDGSVRLIASSGILAVYTAILYPRGILDESPTVLGLRTFELLDTEDFDAVVPMRSLVERIVRARAEVGDDDLGRYLADCLDDDRRRNRVLPIGGPGEAITPKAQGERLFALLGREPRFTHVPVALLDVVVAVLATLGRWSPTLAAKAADEVPPYRELVLGTATFVAEAKGGVTEVESATIAKLEEALGGL